MKDVQLKKSFDRLRSRDWRHRERKKQMASKTNTASSCVARRWGNANAQRFVHYVSLRHTASVCIPHDHVIGCLARPAPAFGTCLLSRCKRGWRNTPMWRYVAPTYSLTHLRTHAHSLDMLRAINAVAFRIRLEEVATCHLRSERLQIRPMAAHKTAR